MENTTNLDGIMKDSYPKRKGFKITIAYQDPKPSEYDKLMEEDKPTEEPDELDSKETTTESPAKKKEKGSKGFKKSKKEDS